MCGCQEQTSTKTLVLCPEPDNSRLSEIPYIHFMSALPFIGKRHKYSR